MKKEDLYKKYGPLKTDVIDYIYKCGYDEGYNAASSGEAYSTTGNVKEIVELPEIEKPYSQRGHVREAVIYAYKARIKQFELEYEKYNYKTLYASARDATMSWFQKNIFTPACASAQKRLRATSILGEGTRYTPKVYKYFSKSVALSVRKLEDREHVYCTLNLEYLDNIEQELYDEILAVYQEKWPMLVQK